MFSFSEEKSDEEKKAQQELAQMEPHMNGCSVPCEVNKGEAVEEPAVWELINSSLTWAATDEMS